MPAPGFFKTHDNAEILFTKSPGALTGREHGAKFLA
jgi:hypothetical protein